MVLFTALAESLSINKFVAVLSLTTIMMCIASRSRTRAPSLNSNSTPDPDTLSSSRNNSSVDHCTRPSATAW